MRKHGGVKMSDEEQITQKTTEKTKTHAEKMLEAIEAVLEGRLLDEYKTLKIANREITKHTFDELRRFRDYYRGEIARQKMRKNGKFKSYRYRF